MKGNETRRGPLYVTMTAAVMLIIVGAAVLVYTLNHHNFLYLQRHDHELENMAQAADASMASQLNNFREELRYVLGRPGFLETENQWHEDGDQQKILNRMQENLITANPLIDNMLAIVDDEIVLASSLETDYYSSRRYGRFAEAVLRREWRHVPCAV